MVMVVMLLMMMMPGVCQGEEDCSDSEIQELQAEYNKCAVQMEYQFEERNDDSEDNTDDESGGCTLVSRTVQDCGKAWKKCYSLEEVQRMQDMQIESLLAQHRSLPLSQCSLVEEYLQSGRREENMVEEDSLCTDMKTVRGQQLFQTCSHTQSTAAYNLILNTEEQEKVRSILCSTLDSIAKDCPKELQECFSAEDLHRTTENHLKEMKKFLLSFAEGKIDEDELVGCGVVKVKKVDSYEEFKDETEDDETDTNYEKSMDKDQSENVSAKPTMVENEHTRVQMDEKSAVLIKAEQNMFQGYHSASPSAHFSIFKVVFIILKVFIL